MTDLDQVRAAIMAAPENRAFTDAGEVPIYLAPATARLLILGQAPGAKTQTAGIPFNDRSGDILRDWLGIDRETFYDKGFVAVLPMDFYYPGPGKTGDLPPRTGFAEKWHPQLTALMPRVGQTLLLGAYAQKHYLGDRAQRNLTETVRAFRTYLPEYFALPHPSPLNFRWQGHNPWFVTEVLPALKQAVQALSPQGSG